MMSEKNIAEIVLEIINEHYAVDKGGIMQKALVTEVLKKRGSSNLAADYGKMQPNVSKVTKRLIARQKITLTKDRTYIPFDEAHLRSGIGERIAETVVFNRDEVFAVSANTLLLGVATDHTSQCIDLLKQYLGEDRYFDVLFLNGYVVVMLRGEEVGELKALHENLQGIVEKSGEIHARTKRKKLEMKKADS